MIASVLLLHIASALAAGARASAEALDAEGHRLRASLLVDGRLGTSWSPGRVGDGEEAWFEVDLGKDVEVEEVSLFAGRLDEGAKSFREVARPRTVEVVLLDARGGEVARAEAVLGGVLRREDVQVVGRARRVRVEIVDVVDGIVFPELHVAEVAVNLGRSADRVERFRRWLETPAARRAMDDHAERVKAAWRKIREAEFGDRDTFLWLVDQAGDGPEPQRSQVLRLVPPGFRVEALRPSAIALDALRKLKDPNAIPAFEMAWLRSWGEEARALRDDVEIFYAWRELVGGPSPAVPPWGEPGWSPGALRSFGEPLALEVDREGRVLVADVGNNRIQRFSERGIVDRRWPATEPEITNLWFDAGRTWYVSGAAPGDDPGRFVNPLDVDLVPGKDADGFAVLDATRRVQVFGPEGDLVLAFRFDAEDRVRPGLGGEAHLAVSPRKGTIFVAWGEELHGFSPEGEPLFVSRLEDGVPSAMEVTAQGKLVMAFARDLVQYDVDGFRWGVLLGPDQLGEGYEAFDVTRDEEGRLWVVTDKGVIHRLNKRGTRVRLSLPFSEVSLEVPRVAVRDEVAYVSDRDRIQVVDVRQALLDLEAAGE